MKEKSFAWSIRLSVRTLWGRFSHLPWLQLCAIAKSLASCGEVFRCKHGLFHLWVSCKGLHTGLVLGAWHLAQWSGGGIALLPTCLVYHNPEDLYLPAFVGGRFQPSHSTGMKVTQWGIKTAVAHPASGFELLYWPSRDGTQNLFLSSTISSKKYLLCDDGL